MNPEITMKLYSETFHFLSDLKNNNQRDWFNDHKDTYLKVKDSLEEFAEGLIQELVLFDPYVKGLSGKKSVMRIYRDVRFSSDKSPYKTNLGASFHNPNHKGNFPGYFLSVGPNESFLAGGYWMPEAPVLKGIRQEMDYNQEKFLKIVDSKLFKETFGGLGQESKLKTLPKGYSEDHPLIEYLKLKSFTVSHSIPDQDFFSDKAFHTIVEGMKAMLPFIQFLREVQPV